MSTASFTYHRKLIIAGLIFAFLMAGCAQTTKPPAEPKVADAATLRVGVTTTSPPFVFKQAGEIVGLDADMAREFARFIGKTPRFVDLKWDDQIPALLENRIDIIMSGMSITNMRQMSIAFSQPYYRSGLMAMVRKRRPIVFQYLFTACSASRPQCASVSSGAQPAKPMSTTISHPPNGSPLTHQPARPSMRC